MMQTKETLHQAHSSRVRREKRKGKKLKDREGERKGKGRENEEIISGNEHMGFAHLYLQNQYVHVNGF